MFARSSHLVTNPDDMPLSRSTEVSKWEPLSRGSAMDFRIKRALLFIQGHFCEHLTANQVARHVGISRSRFEHLFGREAGRCFKTYVRVLRLTKAKDLLVDKTLEVKEVAYMVGYGFAANFTRDFKRYVMETPSVYRLEFRRNSTFC